MNKLAILTRRYARRFNRTASTVWLAVCAVFAFLNIAAAATAASAYNVLAATPGVGMAPVRLCAATLTTPQLLMDVIGAMRKRFPLFNRIAFEFRGTPLKLNEKYIAHVASYGTASTYSAGAGGYANGANEARNGLADVPVVTDNHPTYPLKWKHLDLIKDIKKQYDKVMAGAGYVLGKAAVDNGLFAKCTSRYFSQENITAVADCDYDWLVALGTQMNAKGVPNEGRILVVNSAVAAVLAVDARMISRDYAGQLLDGRGYRQWQNVGGFELILEYPDLPSNNAAQLTGVTGANSGDVMTKVGHGLVTGDPVTFISGTTFTGLTAGTRYFAIKLTDDTFQVATSRANALAGTEVALSADGTAGVFQLQENLVAMAFDSAAFGGLQGVPEGIGGEMAAQLGITEVMRVESISDPESGISMAAAKWQEAGTGDLYWCPTFIYGTNAGKQGDTAVAEATAAAKSVLAAATTEGSGLDYHGLRISSGPSS